MSSVCVDSGILAPTHISPGSIVLGNGEDGKLSLDQRGASIAWCMFIPKSTTLMSVCIDLGIVARGLSFGESIVQLPQLGQCRTRAGEFGAPQQMPCPSFQYANAAKHLANEMHFTKEEGPKEKKLDVLWVALGDAAFA